jgi:aspartyl protease family protein
MNEPQPRYENEPSTSEKSWVREIIGYLPADRISAQTVQYRTSRLTKISFIVLIAIGLIAFFRAEEIKVYAMVQLRAIARAIGIEAPAPQAAVKVAAPPPAANVTAPPPTVNPAAPRQSIGAVKAPESEFAAVYNRLGIAPLPANLERQADIHQGLAVLRQEACDKRAVFKLGEALRNSGSARIAATAYLGFAATCPNGEGDKHQAAQILYQLADYDQVIRITTELIAANPAYVEHRYLRGAALVGEKRYDDALTDYANTIELSSNQRDIGEWVFTEMAAAYASLTRYCMAMTPIQTWVAIDPVNRDTPRARKLIADIADYAKQGDCELRYAVGADSFPRSGNNNVIRTRAKVNGVEGTFVLDTGASFVAVTSSFALRAKVDVSPRSVPVETANGDIASNLGRAANIRVGRAEASDVPIIIQNRSLGRDIDALLGMSFLSRFDLSIGRREWKLSQKK